MAAAVKPALPRLKKGRTVPELQVQYLFEKGESGGSKHVQVEKIYGER